MKSQGGSSFDIICLTKICSIISTPMILNSRDDCNDDDHKETELVPSLNQSTRSIESLIPDSGSLFVDSYPWAALAVIGGYDGFIRL